MIRHAHNTQRRSLYAKHRAAGICVDCKYRPARSGKAKCKVCSTRDSVGQKAFRAAHPGRKMKFVMETCLSCGRPRKVTQNSDRKRKHCRLCYRPGYKGGYAKEKTKEYVAWRCMRDRCLNQDNRAFPGYGGRGITICERWAEFANFRADMGLRPSPGHSLHRIDNNGSYEPSNCRWATRREQAANRRPVARSDGSTRFVKRWSWEIHQDALAV
jgi:hypothetical protein